MRGVIDSSQCASTSAWVVENAWHSRREATTVAKTARLLRRRDLVPAADAVLTGDVDLGTAAVIAAEYDKLAADLRDDAKPIVLEQFLDVGAEYGTAGVRRLRQEILARYGEADEFEKHQEKCRRFIDLSPGNQTSPGIWEYQLITDNEGHAVLEAAIGPPSAPHPDPESGASDVRSVGRRRGEALIDALRRAVAAGGHVPTSPKAMLMVTVTRAELMRRHRRRRLRGIRCGDSARHPCRRDAAGLGHDPQTGLRCRDRSVGPGHRRGEFWTRAANGVCSPPRRSGPCGYATAIAPSTGATRPRNGPTLII